MTNIFAYDAFAGEGKRVAGRIEAESQGKAHDKLLAQALLPVTITQTPKSESSIWQRDIRLRRRIGPEPRPASRASLGCCSRPEFRWIAAFG